MHPEGWAARLLAMPRSRAWRETGSPASPEIRHDCVAAPGVALAAVGTGHGRAFCGRRGADAIILDLEDSVPASEKPRARELVPAAAATVSRGGADVVVGINRPWRQALCDIEVAVGPEGRRWPCPKPTGADHVRTIAEVVDEFEAERRMAAGRPA
jgi:HpcH/HpaI aldolase/citrate lyase family